MSANLSNMRWKIHMFKKIFNKTIDKINIMSDSTHYTIECSEPWFTLLRTGQKVVEGRKGSPLWNKIEAGDIITFTKKVENDSKDSKNIVFFDVKVTGINRYTNPGLLKLHKFFKEETLARVLPGVHTIDDGIKVYLQWSNEEEINKYDFLGIQVEVL